MVDAVLRMVVTVFQIRDILRWILIRILGSVHWITGPDLGTLYISGFKDANEKLLFFWLITVRYVVYVHLHQS